MLFKFTIGNLPTTFFSGALDMQVSNSFNPIQYIQTIYKSLKHNITATVNNFIIGKAD